jgi:chromosome segregation ATPase
MQLALDELRSLEEQNKVITKQLEDEKARVTGDISGSKSEAESLALEKATKESEKAAAEKAKTDAETAKANAEKAKQEAENEMGANGAALNDANARLAGAQNSLAQAQAELGNAQNTQAAKQQRLNNLNAKGRVSTNELNAMKKETGNRRLKKPQAISQVQNEINALSGSIADLSNRVNIAQTEISNAELQIADLNGRNAAAEIFLPHLRSPVSHCRYRSEPLPVSNAARTPAAMRPPPVPAHTKRRYPPVPMPAQVGKKLHLPPDFPAPRAGFFHFAPTQKSGICRCGAKLERGRPPADPAR